MLKCIVEKGIHLQLLPVMKIWVRLIRLKDVTMNGVCFQYYFIIRFVVLLSLMFVLIHAYMQMMYQKVMAVQSLWYH